MTLGATRLFQPLHWRQAERDEILRQFGTIGLPDEEKGESQGLILMLSPGYAVQESAGALVRHDRLLISALPPSGKVVSIRYREGAGSWF